MQLTPQQVTILHKHIDAGLISKSKHQTEDLWIYKYTALAQYSQTWDAMTTMCRGLILDTDYNIVARPFKKFFNLEEHLAETNDYAPPLPNEPYKVYDKLDGSLGILYWINDTPHIATCGRFHSKQAEWATRYIQNWDSLLLSSFNRKYTYLFEIIYQANRIVIDYKGAEELVLLGAIEIETGIDIPIEELRLDLPRPLEFKFETSIEGLKTLGNTSRRDAEGFVIRYKSGLRVKIKLDKYLRIHRIIFGTSSYTIWEHLRNEKPLYELIEYVPDEFYDWVKELKTDLERKFDTIYKDVTRVYNSLDLSKTRKDLALEIQDYPYKGLIFKLLDGIEIKDIIWKLIKPTYSTPFQEED